MKKLIQRLKCWWSGCTNHPHDNTCLLCGEEIDYGKPGAKWEFNDWWRGQKNRLRVWMKCPDCGKRFGRHDDAQDHIPF